MSMLYSPAQRPAHSHDEKQYGNGRGRKSGLKSRGTQLLALRFGWVVLVIWFEVGEFFSSLSSCRFPDAAVRQVGSSKTSPQPTHVVLIADPHVSHPRFSYSSDSNPWVNALRQAFDELFMRKSWNIVMRLGRVDAVIMLGDMLDWGRGVMNEEEYGQYHSIFQSIFQLPPSIPVHYVPGNHDLPLGPHRFFSPHARDRYARYFSPPNSVISIANHSLILLDAVGLVEEDYRRYAAEMQFGEWDGVEGGVIEFVKAAAEQTAGGSNILISHIPLARPERSQCGPHREYGRIQKGAGPGYQNLLGSETSRFLIDQLKPEVIFSADDHDYCEHTHRGGIREVTVKSFSSSTGIQRPGFQLLSLIPPPQHTTSSPAPLFADRPCFLPDQSGVYTTVYLPLVCVTIFYIFITNIRQAWLKWNAATDRTDKTYPEKGRLSPNLALDTSRRFSDRPVALTLPTRRSSSQLTVLSPYTSANTSRAMHVTSRAPSPDLSRSAPGSPYGSPRPSFADEDGEVNLDTPNLSRRSSFIYMNGTSSTSTVKLEDSQRTPRIMSEPSSYFTNREMPTVPGGAGNAGLGLGLGLATPTNLNPYPVAYTQPHATSPGIRRTSSNAPHSHPATPPSAFQHPTQSRRVTMPRLLSSFLPDSDRESKKDRARPTPTSATFMPTSGGMLPILSLTDGQNRSGFRGRLLGGWERIKGFSRWVWKMRNSVIVRSCWELWGLAWVVAVSWVVVNGLFFLG